MAYIVPRVLINQEFTQVPVFKDQPQAALIIGPQYNLYRYSVDSEKALTKVAHPSDSALTNKYQYTVDTTYDFPTQVAGTKVDKDYVKVFIDKAEAVYYPIGELGADDTEAVTRVASPSGYYANRLKAAGLVFKTANDIDRTAEFASRDVKAGDIIDIHTVTGDLTFTTKVKALHYSKTSASIATATRDAANKATVVTDVDNAVVEGGDNTSTVTVANQTNVFKGGWVSGVFVGTETFTATVHTGGNLSAVRFDITSENGLAGSEDTTIVALASLSDVDELSLYTDGANIVKLDFTGSTNFVVGDTFSVTVVAPSNHDYVPTEAGTFTGAVDTTYKLTVVRGGAFYDGSTNSATCARVAITSNATDSSPTVSPQAGVAFAVGSHGVTATFATQSTVYGGLVLGDVYYVAATAAAPAETNIIETYDALPASFVDGSITNWKLAQMRLQKNIEVSELIPFNDSDVNWEVSDEDQTITINSGITTTDANVVSGSDVLLLDVVKGDIFVEHRDLTKTNTASIGSLTDVADVVSVLGTVHPDNPLAQGVYDAVLNSAGVPVYFVGLETDDLAGYDIALKLSEKANAYYGLVPLTFDRGIQDSVVAHVSAMSTPAAAKWRVTWLSTQLKKSELTYDLNESNEDWTATITTNPASNSGEFVLLTMAGATFVTDQVRAGDKVLINFRLDANGKVTNDEYIVDTVETETTLVLVSGPTAALNLASKTQIERFFTKDEQIDTLALVGSDYNNRRVRMVFPDTAKQGTVVKPGYILAAALAGLRSSVVPHQGLTNTAVLGFDDLTATVLTFSPTQLNRLAAEGYFIVQQDVVGATPYVRHQLTTASDSLNTSEDSITSNVDSISYGLQKALVPFIGTYNVNTDTIALISSIITGELHFRATSTYTVRAGNQLNGYKIKTLRVNPVFKDRVDVEITLDVPYPINFITITLVV